MGIALDRIVSVERISGQTPGLGGDQEFRVYVTLKPDTREVLEKSREFFRDHDNTVYHAGYPHSYRQAGKEPSIQISMSDDGLRGDIDVDYRSRKAPQGLFNGHLTSANSDVRMGDNAKRHNNRWQGLIPWWQQVFGRVDESTGNSGDVINSERPDAMPTPLPPDRPLGAAPERLEDAAQEFLTDWLVRHEYEQALAFLSPRAYACLNLEDTGSNKPLDAAAARRELRKLMEYSAGKVGPVPNLTACHRRIHTAGSAARRRRSCIQAGVPGDAAARNVGPHVSVRTSDSLTGRNRILRRGAAIQEARRRHTRAALDPGSGSMEAGVVSAARPIATDQASFRAVIPPTIRRW